MPTRGRRREGSTVRALRRALLSTPLPGARRGGPGAGAAPAASAAAAALPTAPELLDASPNLERLCESYHRSHCEAIARGRRQRIGIGLLVAAVGVGAALLSSSGRFDAASLHQVVLAVAGSGAAALLIMGLLWLRDSRRLLDAQGDRLLRALQFNCTLSEDRLRAFRRVVPAGAAFTDVYATWRTQHPDPRRGLAAVLSGRRHRRALA